MPDAILRARAAILTLPLGVLQAGSVQFDPEPRAAFQAARALAVGHVIRVTLRFQAPFWENNSALKDTGFIFSSHPLFPTWWTTLPVRAPVITGWSAGPRADQLLAVPKSQIVDEAVTALGRVTGIEPPPLEKAYFHDWQADPFSLGAYSYVPAGALPQRAILAEPVEDTLFFAGEATDSGGHSATVHGAIASGRRAAKKIVQNFRLAGRPK
jgi:monoamine oxidase